MSSTKEVREIEVDIPINKINDLTYLQETFLNVSFKLLKELADHSDMSFVDMVNEFIPDEDCITDSFLSNWDLSKTDINLKTKKTKNRKKKTKAAPKSEEVPVEVVEAPDETAVAIKDVVVKAVVKDVVVKAVEDKPATKIKKTPKVKTVPKVKKTPKVKKVPKVKKTPKVENTTEVIDADVGGEIKVNTEPEVQPSVAVKSKPAKKKRIKITKKK